MLPFFQGNFILVEATSSRFFRVTTSAQQLLFRGSYIFRTASFFSFFITVTFLQELFFQNSFFFGAKILQSSHFLRIGGSLQQSLFGTAMFSEKLFRIKISKKELLFQSRYFCTGYQPFQKSHALEKTDFSENQFPHYVLFLESCLFRATTFSKDAIFYSSYFFRRAAFLQHTFLEELLFHSYDSFPQSYFYLFVGN